MRRWTGKSFGHTLNDNRFGFATLYKEDLDACCFANQIQRKTLHVQLGLCLYSLARDSPATESRFDSRYIQSEAP